MRRVRGTAPGFTLIEMVVTMSIFAILVALTVPSMRTWIRNAQLRAAADALQNGVRFAQAESLRRSRQVVFALTTSTNPSAGYTASANGTNWALSIIPLMAGGADATTFIQSGVLSNTTNLQVTGPAAICFNSMGRLVTNNATGIPGAACTVPTTSPRGAGTPPMSFYTFNVPGADHQLEVQVSRGGQVHMCDANQTFSNQNPNGC